MGSVPKRGRSRSVSLVELLEDRRLLSVAAPFFSANGQSAAVSAAVIRPAIVAVTPTVPVDLADPLPASAQIGQLVSFTAAADGTPLPVVQWQSSTDGTTFVNIPGATSPTYTFTAALGESGDMYRAVFSNTSGVVTTTPAALTLTNSATAIIVTADPTPQTIPAGQPVTFTAATSRTPTAVQWQVSAADTTFTNIAGATGSTYTFTPTAAQDGDLFRAVFTSPNTSVATDPAKLTVLSGTTGITITQNPAAQSAVTGQTATFTANASAAALDVQWQLSSDGGVTYSDVPNAKALADTFFPTLSQNGDLFRAIFTNAQGSVATSPALLTVTAAPVVPTAAIIAPDVPSAGGNGESITVVYNVAAPTINTSTIAPSNITIVGPNNRLFTASVFDVITAGNVATVTYTITPPNGTWRPSDDGTYTVNIAAGSIHDANGLGNSAASATFHVHADRQLVVGITATTTANSNAQSDDFTATVSNRGPGGPVTKGTVTFFSDGAAIGTVPVTRKGIATFVGSASLTSHAITALYNGDKKHPAGSSGLPFTQTPPAPTPLAVTPALDGALPELVIAGQTTTITQTLSITNVSGGLFHETLNIKVFLVPGTTVPLGTLPIQSMTMPFRLANESFKTLPLKVKGIPASIASGTYHLVVVLQGADGRTSSVASADTITVSA